MGEPLVLATYNIHGAVGVDGRYDPERVARVIASLDADAVALQEVDSRRHSGGSSQLRYLGETLGYEAVAGATITGATGEYGNALLTRLEVRRVERLDLSVVRREPRGALDVTIARGNVTARLIATHLGLRAPERHRQVGRLVEAFGDPPAGTLAVLGDFNEWLPLRAAVRVMRRYFGPAPTPATFPSRFPFLRLDRAWVHPGECLLDARVARAPEARVASDHLPLRVVVAI